MRVRRYQMGSPRAKRLSRLLRNEKVSVRKVEVVAHGNREDVVYVFFDYAKEEDAKDKETLKRLKEKAAEVSIDTVYAKLKNVKQRELYLLEHYNLSKKDSGDVVELLKIMEIEADIAEGKTGKKDE